MILSMKNFRDYMDSRSNEHEELPGLYGFAEQVHVSIFKRECIIDLREIEEALSFLSEDS